MPISPLPAHTESGDLRNSMSTYTDLYSRIDENRHVQHSSMSYTTSVAHARSEKASQGAEKHTVPRFVLHTDAGSVDTESVDEVVELPPQYDDRRPGPSTAPDEKE